MLKIWLSLLLLALPQTVLATIQSANAGDISGSHVQKFQSVIGLLVLLGITWAIGRWFSPKGRVMLRTVVWGIGLQFLFAVLVLYSAPGEVFFKAINDGVVTLLGFSEEGARFLFGDLVKNNVPVGQPVGDPLMGPVLEPSAYAHTGAFFAFSVLPTIIFFASLSAVLYYLGIMRWVVEGMARIMQKTMGTSGAETLSSAANIFLGQSEAPLMVRPFIPRLTRSEMNAIMVGGFANIASGVLAAYVGMLKGYVPNIAGHLLAASIISAPCSLVVAKLMLPEDGNPETSGHVKMKMQREASNVIDAAARGAMDGLRLAFAVGGMLIAFIALVSMLNAMLGWAGGLVGFPTLSFEWIMGIVMAPLAWLMGVPWSEATSVGSLLGIKTVLNEFVAYLELASILGSDPGMLSMRSVIIAAYALCGFANFGSVAIMIGCLSALAPDRRKDISELGLYAMVGGTLCSLMTGCVVGALL